MALQHLEFIVIILQYLLLFKQGNQRKKPNHNTTTHSGENTPNFID